MCIKKFRNYGLTLAAILLMILPGIKACNCPDQAALTKELCAPYDVIFRGLVDSVTVCQGGYSTAWFHMLDLFKGDSYPENSVRFDCSSDCQMSFARGEEWIIYAKYYKYGKLDASFCSRSRKMIENGDDFYTSTNHMTYTDEKNALLAFLGKKKILVHEKEILPERKLIQPSGYWKLWLLLISLVVMYLILYFVKKLP